MQTLKNLLGTNAAIAQEVGHDLSSRTQSASTGPDKRDYMLVSLLERNGILPTVRSLWSGPDKGDASKGDEGKTEEEQGREDIESREEEDVESESDGNETPVKPSDDKKSFASEDLHQKLNEVADNAVDAEKDKDTTTRFIKSSGQQPKTSTSNWLLNKFTPSSSAESHPVEQAPSPEKAAEHEEPSPRPETPKPVSLSDLVSQFSLNTAPESARMKTDAEKVVNEPLTLKSALKLVPIILGEGSTVAKAAANHAIYGPKKKSWGIELTLFTALMRQLTNFRHLSSIYTLRMIVDTMIHMPVPKNGIVTPVSFTVKKRNLRGLLADADAKEDGTRRLAGEWVINRRLWRKMQDNFKESSMAKANDKASDKASDKPNESSLHPPEPNPTRPTFSRTSSSSRRYKPPSSAANRVILYIHGGGYFVMSPQTHRSLTVQMSRFVEARVFAVDYRLAPESHFPSQILDCVAAYFRLILDLKIPPQNVIFAGDSAGASLCLALMMYLRDNDYPLPCGAILMSPWCDLTMSCDSITTNAPYDYLSIPTADEPLNPVRCYLGPYMRKFLTHPYASPIFGDFRGLPPLLIQSGDSEIFRDEIAVVAHKAARDGVHVEHEVYEDGVHVFQIFPFHEASAKAFHSIRRFVRKQLPLPVSDPPLDSGSDGDNSFWASERRVSGGADKPTDRSSSRLSSNASVRSRDQSPSPFMGKDPSPDVPTLSSTFSKDNPSAQSNDQRSDM